MAASIASITYATSSDSRWLYDSQFVQLGCPPEDYDIETKIDNTIGTWSTNVVVWGISWMACFKLLVLSKRVETRTEGSMGIDNSTSTSIWSNYILLVCLYFFCTGLSHAVSGWGHFAYDRRDKKSHAWEGVAQFLSVMGSLAFQLFCWRELCLAKQCNNPPVDPSQFLPGNVLSEQTSSSMPPPSPTAIATNRPSFVPILLSTAAVLSLVLTWSLSAHLYVGLYLTLAYVWMILHFVGDKGRVALWSCLLCSCCGTTSTPGDFPTWSANPMAALGSACCVLGFLFQVLFAGVCGDDGYEDCFVDCPLPDPMKFNHNAMFHLFLALGLLLQGLGNYHPGIGHPPASAPPV